MAEGPGVYDSEASIVQQLTEARSVLLVVIEGNRGSGFSVQAELDFLLYMPKLLRNIADEIEKDVKNGEYAKRQV